MDIDIEKLYAAQQKLKNEIWEAVKYFNIETGFMPIITLKPIYSETSEQILGNEIGIKIDPNEKTSIKRGDGKFYRL